MDKLKFLFFIALFWRLVSTAHAIDLERITINGYTSFEIEKQVEKKGDGGGDPYGSFDADLIDLVFNFQVSDRIRASTDITWEHGAATEDDYGNVAIEYGFIEYVFYDLLKVRVGKMFTPFGIFNEIHTAKVAFLSVKEAAGTNKTERIVDGAYRFFPRWGTGIMLQGDGILGKYSYDYNLLFSNGSEQDGNPYEEDNNKSKAVTGRVRFYITQDLWLSNFFYYEKIATNAFEDLFSDGLEFHSHWKALEIMAEVVYGRLENDVGYDQHQLGWFVQPSYHFGCGVTPYVRFDYVDPDLEISNNEGFDIITGINWEPYNWFMIKVENNYFQGAKKTSLAQFPNNDYNEIKAAVVLGF